MPLVGSLLLNHGSYAGESVPIVSIPSICVLPSAQAAGSSAAASVASDDSDGAALDSVSVAVSPSSAGAQAVPDEEQRDGEQGGQGGTTHGCIVGTNSHAVTGCPSAWTGRYATRCIQSSHGLEHALLVALRERAASGLELARRFDRSIGYFWHASHQQIYRTLARMEGDGWVRAETVAQSGRPDKKVYAVTPAGAAVLRDWLAAPTPMEPLRSELAVKLRGAAYGDRAAVLAVARDNLADHALRLAHYEHLADARLPRPGRPDRPRPRPVPRAARRDPARGVLGRLAHRVPGGPRSRHARPPRRSMTDYPHLLAPITLGPSPCATAW